MEWRVIPGYSRYSVSDTGLVRRDVRIHNSMPGLVSMSVRHGGYWGCALTSDDGSYQNPTVHTLVAAAFLGPRPAGMMVCHNDGNPKHNVVGNLRYDTATGNVHDAIRHGTQARGTRQHLAKLNENKVAEIRRRFIQEPVTQATLADEYGISSSTMLSLIKGETWTHVAPFGDLRDKREHPPLVGFRGHTKTSAVKGVSFASRRNKWVARGPHQNGKPVCLGEYRTELEAIAAVENHLLAKPTGETAPTASGRTQRIWEAV